MKYAVPMRYAMLYRLCFQFCDNFKKSSDQCAACGLQLSSNSNESNIRHFGLQLLEHCVKYDFLLNSIESEPSD